MQLREHRNPALNVLIGSAVAAQHPEYLQHLATNKDRLTEHTDLHAAIISLGGRTAARGINFLTTEIPAGRTCADTLIPAENCNCFSRNL